MKQAISDKVLVGEILSGNETYLRMFYSIYKPLLVRFIAPYIAVSEDAEEIVQDTLMDSLEAFRDFTFKCTLYTFLCAIAKRKCFDYYRKKRISKVLFTHLPILERMYYSVKTPEEEYDEKALLQTVSEIFSRLTPKHRTLLRLKYIEGYSVKQIADQLSVSFKTAESSLFRARKAFVKAYNNYIAISYE
jgi:RNA polymerase sigma-70 factor (ECF subfamily)